ncbi:MAG: DNA polymerase III subunit gamma/tau [Microthrixaceae bacterium]|nr:DNA polymerase III subunit gamma/tau [Microthrixaceae bacterium]
MAYQSLYRRYRPRRFSDVRGQEQVVRALRNAVRDDRVGHAYLFSGPRGTGKTSTARILAKALNCEQLADGEPCGTCDSCTSIDSGTSYDVQELDAASNNGVENVRELVGRANLGSPGRTKVYILDEVHMLTAAASAALLKTLEEPPDHVVFVLATTDPHKVLATIRSRTQHYEFHLLSADELAEHVAWVIHDAGLELDPEVIDPVVRAGAGSARDTLSALDRVAAAGGVVDDSASAVDLVNAIAAADAGRALVAVADALGSGRDARVLGEEVLARLRDVFLLRMGGGHRPPPGR